MVITTFKSVVHNPLEGFYVKILKKTKFKPHFQNQEKNLPMSF